MVVYNVAPRKGLGCVLMQHDRVISYTFCQLRLHEKKYPTHYLKLVVVIFTLKIWRRYLLKDHVEINIDHKSLRYMFT